MVPTAWKIRQLKSQGLSQMQGKSNEEIDGKFRILSCVRNEDTSFVSLIRH